MKIFKSKMLTWWHVGLLKLSLLFIGIAIGVYWQDVFLPYVSWLLVIGVVLGLYVAKVWLR